MSLNHHQVLKVGTNATQNQIKDAYQKLQQLWSSRKANETITKKELSLLKEAFEVLSSHEKRKEQQETKMQVFVNDFLAVIKKERERAIKKNQLRNKKWLAYLEKMKSQYGINYQGLRLYTYCSKSPKLQKEVNLEKIKVEQIF